MRALRSERLGGRKIGFTPRRRALVHKNRWFRLPGLSVEIG
jgi:hypothetical protein